MKQIPPISAGSFIHGYYAEPRGRRTTEMSAPAVNMFIDSSGSAVTRPGFEDTEWNLNNANHAAEPLWISEYNVTFFAFDNDLKCIDHENADAVYDMGLTITAESTLSYYNGCIYVTNETNGATRVAISRLDAAALIAATEVFIEDGTTFRFKASGAAAILINGTSESLTARDDTDYKFTGMSLTQGYSSGALVTQAETLSIPKAKKYVFWNEAMHGIGVQSLTSSQAAKRTLFYGDFFDAGDWKNVEDFSGGLSGTTGVGRSGELTNILAVEDYLYIFTESESYSINDAGIDVTTGARPARLFSSKYGCLNHRSAAEMDGRIAFITQNNRFIRSRVNSGGRLEPDEQWDAPIRKLLVNMDPLQPHSLVFYWEEANYLMHQVSIDGQIVTLIWDNNPITNEQGSTEGRWLPPVLNWQVKNYFTIDGKLYGTDIMDDTVYQFAVGESDDGGDIECTFASGIYQISQGRTLSDWGDWEVAGGMTSGTNISFLPKVGEKDGTEKTFDSTGLDFGSSTSVGEVVIGRSLTISPSSSPFAHFDKSLRIAPAKGRSFQAILSSEGDGHAFRVDSWRLPKVKYYGKSLLSTI